jgi:membrane fusion protein (multidrug efflux system)
MRTVICVNAKAFCLTAIVVASIIGCGDSAQQGAMEMPPMPVEAAEVVRETMIDQFTAVGTLNAVDAVEVAAEIDGRIVALPFREGEAIREGDLIAQLDDEQLRAERDRAEAIRDQRRLSLGRTKSIVNQGAGSKQDLDDAMAAFKVADAELALAEARLSKTRITAPFTGIVGARQVNMGEFVRPGKVITNLAQIDELRATFTAPERFLSYLRQGAALSVSSPAVADKKLEGHIEVIEPIVDPMTRSVDIVAHVSNTDRLFRPGVSASISVVLSQRDSALVIPSESIFAEGSQLLVFIINADGSVVKTPIKTGSRSSDLVEVIDGLEAGQQVVKSGHQKLFPGARVMAVNAQTASAQTRTDATDAVTDGAGQ